MLPMPRFDLPRAARSLNALLKNPDDLPQVFSLIEALSGTTPHRMMWKFERTEAGRAILNDQPDIVPVLADRDALRRMPAGSLAHAYLAFVESEGISAEGIVAAAKAGQQRTDGPFAYMRSRMRDTHDLWHAVTGYQGDVLGELSLLAFLLGQHWNSAIAAIVSAGLLKGFAANHDPKLVLEGYRRGRNAEWLPSQPWESMLALPVSEVRERLKVGPLPEYTPVRSSQLREAGIVTG